MTNPTWCFIQNCTRPFFAVQLLKEADGSVVSLVGATVAFYFRHIDSNQAKVSAASITIRHIEP